MIMYTTYLTLYCTYAAPTRASIVTCRACCSKTFDSSSATSPCSLRTACAGASEPSAAISRACSAERASPATHVAQKVPC